MTLRNIMLGTTALLAPDDGSTGGTETVVVPAAAAAAGTAWTEGLDAEIVGHAQTKGWDKLDPAAAAREIAKAHREAEKFVGADTKLLLRMPKDASDEVGLKAFYERLGVPADAAGYDLTSVKVGDKDLDAGFADFVRTTAAALHLPKDQAPALAQAILKQTEDATTAAAAERTAKIAEERAALDKDWGQAKDANLFIAKQAAEKLGVTKEAIAALEGQLGYKDVMNMMLKIGQNMGEDKFVKNLNPNVSGVMTREQAVSKKDELMHDTNFGKRVFEGDAQALREIRALDFIIVGADDTDDSRNR